MGNTVYITGWKNEFWRTLPQDDWIYHYTPKCMALVKNPARHTTDSVDKDEEALDKKGFRACLLCEFMGIELGSYVEDGTEEDYFPTDEDIAIMKTSPEPPLDWEAIERERQKRTEELALLLAKRSLGIKD